MSLLGLPRELRDMIYDYALRPDSLIFFASRNVSHRYLPIGHSNEPLTRVNRQIRSETLPVFYQSHRFQLSIGALRAGMTWLLNWINATQDYFRYMDGILLTGAVDGTRLMTWGEWSVKLCFFKNSQKEVLQMIQADRSGRYYYVSDPEVSIQSVSLANRRWLGYYDAPKIDLILNTLAKSLDQRDMRLVLDFACSTPGYQNTVHAWSGGGHYPGYHSWTLRTSSDNTGGSLYGGTNGQQKPSFFFGSSTTTDNTM